MNSSDVSVYDNINTPDSLFKSCVCKTLNDLLNVNTEWKLRIFCPLCVKNFSLKFYLFEHLRMFHRSFLVQANNKTIKFEECPFCDTKFYGNHLTAKHVLIYHSKVITGLFVNKNRSKCFFCNKKLLKEDHDSAIQHIEDFHFLQFEEHLRKMFLCDASQTSMPELVNSSVEDSESTQWEFTCMNSGHSVSASEVQDFDEASKVNCYDFTELKQQLENIKAVMNSATNSESKPILKDIKNKGSTHKTARRVLRFDLQLPDKKNKENLLLKNNFDMLKQISLKECHILSNEKKQVFFKLSDTFCEKPQHSSTPNFKDTKISENKLKTNSVVFYKSKFKSYITEKKINEFEFQCGKCRSLFKKNLELVSHMKNNHKKFSFSVFQPCYNCAICNARFYKNHYLRKHHKLHRPY